MISNGIQREVLKFVFSISLVAMLFISARIATAQTTQFTYQGKLTDNGTTINALYDFTLTLWDASSNGNQIGSTQNVQSIAVVDGIFTVTLDFGAGAFNGANRFLEISVKPNGSPATPTLLSPRQQVLSTPYSIKSMGSASADSLSVSCVNCINSSQIAGLDGAKITGTIAVASIPAGSSSYIQNTTSQQVSSNFNISGTGRADTIDVTKLHVSGTGVVRARVDSDSNAGLALTLNNQPKWSVATLGAGQFQIYNDPIGQAAVSIDGGNNLGIGTITPAAKLHVSGSGIVRARVESDTNAGLALSLNNQQKWSVATLGAGEFQVFNDPIGLAAVSIDSATNNLGIGTITPAARLHVAGNGIVTNNLGIGTITPAARLHISGAGVVRARVDSDTNAGLALTLNNQPKWSVATLSGGQFQIFNDPSGQAAVAIDSANDLGVNTISPQARLHVNGNVRVDVLGSAGATSLCRNANNVISTCSSSLRYKNEVQNFTGGLNIINRLRPITFTWKTGELRDIGFGAEEVEKVEPLLTFRNDQGEIEGVKYGQITAVLVNAIKEQQAQINSQENRIDTLTRIVCLDHPKAEICRVKRDEK